MIKILLAEDDKDLNAVITSYLKSLEFEVFSVYNGLDALNVLYEVNIDLILSDIMMPLCDGFELARNVREKDKKIPILFMSARDDKPSKEIGYKAGIDDYITKPFDLDELGFKIKAILRRLEIAVSNKLTIKNFTINAEEHTAKVNGEDIPLTVREFDILFCLLSNPNKIFTRSTLMERFWDYDSSATSRTVDVYLSKLREKTKACEGFEIQTIHGLGYKVKLK